MHPKPRARRDSARLFADAKAAPVKNTPRKVPKADYKTLNNSPLLWTKNPKPAKNISGISRILGAVAGFFSLVGKAVLSGVKALFRFTATVASKSKAALTILILTGGIIVVGLVDFGLTWDKIYQGVHVGEVDLSGKTVGEAEILIEKTYAPRLSDTTVYVFADENAKIELSPYLQELSEEDGSAQSALLEAAEAGRVWILDSGSMGATLNEKGMIEDAFAQGRENGGIVSRIQTALFGTTIHPFANYDPDAIESVSAGIDTALGSPRVNYDVRVVEGEATVILGHAGDMINRKGFAALLDEALLYTDETKTGFIANIEHADLQITEEMAEETAAEIEARIIHGAQFIYNGVGWDSTPTDVGDWVQTRVVEEDGGYKLEPYIEYELAKGSLMSHLKANFSEEDARVTFTDEGGTIYVSSQVEGVIPQSREAVSLLDAVLFESVEPRANKPVINVATNEIPDKLELQEAIDYGIVGLISEYTTEYTPNVENRNHNIHLAADLINDSIVPAEGGEWSFHETAGNCNEEAGFKGASTIIDDEYVDEIGGGICQVATTVFNAVYESGFPIIRRHNHSLYSAVYPSGRDAAVYWPDLDLIWENESTSDVLVVTGYTDSSLTVYLYGVSSGYTVATVTGNWEEGEKHGEKKVTDETLAEGTSYIKTPGVDGSKITVYRTVKDKEGTVIRQDAFTSVYSPKDEVIAEGPKPKDVQ